MPATDPITGLEIPPAWIELSQDPDALVKIRNGSWVILSDGRLLRRGFTTGTTAAAACKGAVLSLKAPREEIEVMTPAGLRVRLPVQAREGTCVAVKDSGDHEFDVTRGIEIVASARAAEETKLLVGDGIGLIIGQGLCAPQGKPAISQRARKQINLAIEEAVLELGLRGAVVELSVPRGKEIAEKTLNPRLGVHGGISILGSTGFVEPWNEHLTETRVEELRSLKKVVVTTGQTGLRFSRVLFPDHKAVLIGSQLERLEFESDQESVLCGLPALILKWAWPEILEETGFSTVAEMVEKEPDHPRITRALSQAKFKLPHTRIVLLQRDGRVFKEAL